MGAIGTPTTKQRADKGPGVARPLFFCPENPGSHIENRIGMASQVCAWWNVRRLGHKRAQRAVTPRPLGGSPRNRRFRGVLPLWRCESSPAHHHHASSSRPRGSLGGRLPVEREVAGSIPVEGAIRQKHQGGLTGRARGPEPRDGGSSPSPGANPPDLAKWEGGGLQNCQDRVRILTPRNLRFRGDPEEGSGPIAGVAQR